MYYFSNMKTAESSMNIAKPYKNLCIYLKTMTEMDKAINCSESVVSYVPVATALPQIKIPGQVNGRNYEFIICS